MTRSFAVIITLTIALGTYAPTYLLAQTTDKPAAYPAIKSVDTNQLISRIAFGSCGHQDKPHPILKTVVDKQPDLFIYLGDNIYGDTKDMKVLKDKYDKLAAKPEFQKLRSEVTVLSTWDDHDYGWNDAGKEYAFKKESKQIFMDFWNVPADSPRRKHEGIYGSHSFSKDNKTVQIIILDTRTFRDLLKRNPKPIPADSGLKNAYQPDDDPNKTMLGAAQWKWLNKTFREPADLRIVCTSIQFGHQYNGWESWTNFPREREKMVETIRNTKANGVVFISGDVHWGEISKRSEKGVYPLFDVTASGITQDWHNFEPNKFRVGEVYRKNHVGLIEIDWKPKDPSITMQIIDVDGKTQISHAIQLSDLQTEIQESQNQELQKAKQ